MFRRIYRLQHECGRGFAHHRDAHPRSLRHLIGLPRQATTKEQVLKRDATLLPLQANHATGAIDGLQRRTAEHLWMPESDDLGGELRGVCCSHDFLLREVRWNMASSVGFGAFREQAHSTAFGGGTAWTVRLCYG